MRLSLTTLEQRENPAPIIFLEVREVPVHGVEQFAVTSYTVSDPEPANKPGPDGTIVLTRHGPVIAGHYYRNQYHDYAVYLYDGAEDWRVIDIRGRSGGRGSWR